MKIVTLVIFGQVPSVLFDKNTGCIVKLNLANPSCRPFRQNRQNLKMTSKGDRQKGIVKDYTVIQVS